MLFLFDIDGTLLLSGGAGARALNKAFAELFEVDNAMEKVSPAGKTDPNIVDEAFSNAFGRSPSQAETRAVIERYEQVIESVLRASECTLMPEVEQTLTTLGEDSSAHVGVATGNTEVGARAKLERAKLLHHFSFGGYGSDARQRKDVVAKAITRGNTIAQSAFDSRSVIVIGDTPADVQAAHDCGVVAVAIATGRFSLPELRAAGADIALPTLSEFCELAHGWLHVGHA